MITEFTPFAATVGGLLIGTSAVITLFALGKIMGVSGILGNLLLASHSADTPWRAMFLLGLVLALPLFWVFGGASDPSFAHVSKPTIILSGLLVGFGTRLGSGCTSGHGVCGIARFSRRSIAATVCFMLVAALTVFIVRHVL